MRLDRDLIDIAADRRATVSVMVLEIDSLGSLVETLGRQAGDGILLTVGDALARKVRSKDIVHRSGAEQFCVLLRGAAIKEAMRVAERVRAASARLVLPFDDIVTVSIGVAVGRGADVAKTLDLARSALTEAQRGGRDRIRLAGVR
ncbi:MAG: hypothetical protein JWL72_3376 [Ilumatobacteraceae bacterium]|nr:hypothetical protein [Ilumatobacteraceae bacterium]